MKNNFPTFIELSALDPGDAESARFGGKALGLARLRREGYRTPEGFALAAVTESPDRWPAEARAGLERRCAELLAGGPIAVRSSALGEDSERRSFAGLFETTLDVRDVPAALAAAARTIASGASDRVRSYAGGSGPVPVGVVFQRMISPRAAGVLFTRDPVGRDPASVLEAVAGLGESLVSGRAAPERWRIYRTGFGTIEARREAAVTPVLSETEARDISAAGRVLAERWKRDLDLEWALGQDGSAWWLQARPITTGAPWKPPEVLRSAPGQDDGPVTVWSTWNLRESLPDPIPRLTWSLMRHSLVPIFTREFMGVPGSSSLFPQASPADLVDGRICFNMNALHASPILGRILPQALSGIDARAGRTTARLIADGILRPRRIRWGPVGKMRARLQMAWRLVTKIPKLFRPREALRSLARADDRLATRPPVADLDDLGLIREILMFDLPESRVLEEDGLLFAIAGSLSVAADGFFRGWPEAKRRLAAAGEGTHTLMISLALDRLVAEARPLDGRFSSGTAGEILRSLRSSATRDAAAAGWLQSLDQFLSRFGHRAPKEIDLAVPRWVEEPGMIVDLVRSRLLAPGAETVTDRTRRLRSERRAWIDDAVARSPVWRRPLMRFLARAVPELLPLREAPKHHIMAGMLRARRAALKLGRRLVERMVFKSTEDVFHLEIEELEALARGVGLTAEEARRRVERRREDLEEFRRKEPPDFLRSDGVPVDDPEYAASGMNPDGSLRGAGVGGGIAEGPVRILDQPDPRRVRPGDVLVMRFADPAWTPLFSSAAAVVMEVGGEMCHAAVITRELGIPGVFGVPGATRLLKEGERVRVDGNTGRVVPIRPTSI
ncbi:MAG TPA: PEP/pyruvate-binding domain-containing protein [Planctomycetota bacterium]|nr:PEP/pyruvate-binding domain-containing protein [Planctomycetota bacterium]